MRLLYVIDSLAPGGAEISLREMAPLLVHRGVELHVLPLGADHTLASAIADAGATIHGGEPAGSRLSNIRRVLKAIHDVGPDLVHTTLFESDIAGRIAARVAGLPASTSVVGDTYGDVRRSEVSPMRLGAALALDKLTVGRSTRFHAVSVSISRAISVSLGVPSDRIEVVPRGRNPDSFPFRSIESRTAARAQLGLPPGRDVILTVGRLDPAKGFNTLFEAFPRIVERHPNVLLILAGADGSASATLRAAARAWPANVSFLGHRTDIPRLLTAADVFCFPSQREGSPGALIEALAVGCPIIASDIPPVLEILGEGAQRVGTMTSAGNASNLGDALLWSLTGDSSLHSLALKGRAKFETLYTIGAVADRMIGFFHRVAGD